MLTLNLNNLSKIAAVHSISPQEISSQNSKLSNFLTKIHQKNQGFYQILDDKNPIAQINSYAHSIKDQFSDIIVFGIGGSSLGTICLQQSLKHLFENELPPSQRKFPRLHVIDNIDPALMSEMDDILDYQKTLFIIVTKSGGTPETLAQYFYIRQKIDAKNLDPKKHFVFITDAEKGLLRKIARSENIPSFAIPENIGGRFSVLTPVGLLPAALIGIEINQLIEGAKTMRAKFLNENPEENLPFQFATLQYLLGEKGKTINVLMPYSQKLIRLADWYRQLLAESIGKEKNNAGEIINTGLTPVNALGVTDQHSQTQLYAEGPNDKFFIFLKVENLGPNLPIPNLFPEDETTNFLKQVNFSELMQTELKATAQALTKYQKPNITIEIDEVTAYSLGELFLFFEASIAFLGEFYEINAFDQPGVELSKILTKEYLLDEN